MWFKTVDFNCQNIFNQNLMQIAELCHEIEDRDDALAKAREAAHKAQLQKYQASISPFISILKLEHRGVYFCTLFSAHKYIP